MFFATNSRIMADTTSNLFVTAFYGVLDPDSGQLVYSNAGHNPPYLVRPGKQVIIQELIRTGIPIGVQEGAAWNKAFVQFKPGDRLLLYTDGIPEADNGDGEYLTTGPMLELAKFLHRYAVLIVRQPLKFDFVHRSPHQPQPSTPWT